jgi:hypothetical protein
MIIIEDVRTRRIMDLNVELRITPKSDGLLNVSITRTGFTGIPTELSSVDIAVEDIRKLIMELSECTTQK